MAARKQTKPESESKISVPEKEDFSELQMDEDIEKLGREILELETLDTRSSDRLDFHDLPVWTLRRALKAAYLAGKAAR